MYSKSQVAYQRNSQINSKNPTTKTPLTLTMMTLSLASVMAMTGCATSSLLEGGSSRPTSTKTTKQILVEDQLVAFGRPAQQLPNMPANSMVIVGEKNSYVLSQGGAEMTTLLTSLTPQNIQVDSDMSFYSPKNDGYFQGTMKLSYAKLKDEFKRSDYQFFLQHGGKECTTDSDTRIDAQRFCFTVPIKGGVYPQVSNFNMIQSKYQALTKPYAVSIYTQSTQEQANTYHSHSGAEKLVLLPFALAFDVVTLPFQLLAY